MNSENSSSVQGQFMNETPGNSFKIVESLASELSSKELDLPAFPDIAVQILDALNDPALSADMMARIVRSDPVLTARLMRLANSAMLMRGLSGGYRLKNGHQSDRFQDGTKCCDIKSNGYHILGAGKQSIEGPHCQFQKTQHPCRFTFLPSRKTQTLLRKSR